MRFRSFLIILYLGSAAPGGAAIAQSSKPAPSKPAPAKPAAEAPQQKQQLTIETVQLVLLIKSAIMALQHANQTGNYSVLRDLGTPVFRERFDQTKLAAAFSNLRSRSVNLSPVMILTPNLVKQPEADAAKPASYRRQFPDPAAANPI